MELLEGLRRNWANDIKTVLKEIERTCVGRTWLA
jgi:hypothetical protein